MAGKSDCPHMVFAASVTVNRIKEPNTTPVRRYVADVTIQCKDCGEKFRFLDVPPGLSFTHPTVSVDGCELRAPIEPEGEKMLFTKMRFEMPPGAKGN